MNHIDTNITNTELSQDKVESDQSFNDTEKDIIEEEDDTKRQNRCRGM
jgi:hypothetical protein